MTIDPFATANDQAETPAENTTKETNVTNTVSDQDKIVTTLKGGSGYDAPWIVIHSDSPEDALETLNNPAMEDLINRTQEVGKFFAKLGNPAPARGNNGGGGGGGNRSKGKPAGATQAPDGQQAPEGYVYKSGVSKAGKPWEAFMPIDRNSGLKPIWL